MSGWIATGVASALLWAIGAGLVILGLRRPRTGVPTCGSCGYALAGVPAPPGGSVRCPECGWSWPVGAGGRAPCRGPRRRGLVLVGVLLMAAGWVGWRAEEWAWRGPHALVPVTAWLGVHAVVGIDPESALGRELEVAALWPGRWRWQRDAALTVLASRYVRWGAAEGSGPGPVLVVRRASVRHGGLEAWVRVDSARGRWPRPPSDADSHARMDSVEDLGVPVDLTPDGRLRATLRLVDGRGETIASAALSARPRARGEQAAGPELIEDPGVTLAVAELLRPRLVVAGDDLPPSLLPQAEGVRELLRRLVRRRSDPALALRLELLRDGEVVAVARWYADADVRPPEAPLGLALSGEPEALERVRALDPGVAVEASRWRFRVRPDEETARRLGAPRIRDVRYETDIGALFSGPGRP